MTDPYHLVPISHAEANAAVLDWHRHNTPTVGHKYSIGLVDHEGVLVGVAIVGRPIARHYDDGQTLEVLRVAVADTAHNGCSMLYGAARRAAWALGYTRLITYTRADEPGTSLRAAGWRTIAHRPPHKGWTGTRKPTGGGVARTLWEAL